MGLENTIKQWLDAERGTDPVAKKSARDRLVTELWSTYHRDLKKRAERLAPGEQSDILNSAFKKLVMQLDEERIEATTREEFFRILRRKILDKVFERRRRDKRHQRIRPIFLENALIGQAGAGDDGSELADGLAQWGISSEPPPEFQTFIVEMLEAIPQERDRRVLLLKIEHLEQSRNVDPDIARSNVEIARILRVSDKEVSRSLGRICKNLPE